MPIFYATPAFIICGMRRIEAHIAYSETISNFIEKNVFVFVGIKVDKKHLIIATDSDGDSIEFTFTRIEEPIDSRRVQVFHTRGS